jgi:hypothetical protein
MTRCYKGALISAAVLCAIGASAAYAQQPPDIVQSDSRDNTAMGTGAMANAPAGTFNNTAVGYQALAAGPAGGDCCGGNTAVGSFALAQDTAGEGNTGIGDGALYSNVSGNSNVAIGGVALSVNTSGSNNTATGAGALRYNTTGSYNTASGENTLFNNGSGDYNTSFGYESLYNNAGGAGNTALGVGALQSNTIGGNNIAVGAYAGSNITSGYRNIDIGNGGAKGDAGTIRLGTSGQHFATYVAGINGVHLTGSAVYISSSGQLGVLASSERYKTAIEPMAQRTEKLKQLRPVTFHLKTDPKGDVQYGLIAEEVAQVYPELVIRNEKGRIEGVRYEELAPMLLNEVQQQAQELREMRRQLAELQQFKRSLQGRAAGQ